MLNDAVCGLFETFLVWQGGQMAVWQCCCVTGVCLVLYNHECHITLHVFFVALVSPYVFYDIAYALVCSALVYQHVLYTTGSHWWLLCRCLCFPLHLSYGLSV